MARAGSGVVARWVLGPAALVAGILLAGLATFLVPRDLLLGVLTGEVAAGLLGGGLWSLLALRTVGRPLARDEEW
jgi:hypothetical protein